MAKILILGNSSSGLYGFRNELVVNLLEHHSVYVSLPDDTNNQELSAEGCKLIHTPINRRGMNPVQDFKLFLAYCKIIKEVKPDVVLGYTIKPNVYGGLASSIKKVPYLANITGLGSALENGGVLQKLTLFLYKMGLRKACGVFLQNQSNLAFFEKHKITKAKKILIPGSGVNLEKHQFMEMPEDTIEGKTHCSEFIYISRVMREKGIEQYLDAAGAIKKKYPNTKFHILGYCEENYQDRLEKEVGEGIICYHGSVKDVRPYIAKCQCIIHPSFYPEGMSNVCLESAASGRAVITTKRPGCGETVSDGTTGYLVEPQNTEEVIVAVEKFLNLSMEEKRTMGQAGREKMEREFNRNLIVEAYNKQLEEIFNTKIV